MQTQISTTKKKMSETTSQIASENNSENQPKIFSQQRSTLSENQRPKMLNNNNTPNPNSNRINSSSSTSSSSSYTSLSQSRSFSYKSYSNVPSSNNSALPKKPFQPNNNNNNNYLTNRTNYNNTNSNTNNSNPKYAKNSTCNNNNPKYYRNNSMPVFNNCEASKPSENENYNSNKKHHNNHSNHTDTIFFKKPISNYNSGSNLATCQQMLNNFSYNKNQQYKLITPPFQPIAYNKNTTSTQNSNSHNHHHSHHNNNNNNHHHHHLLEQPWLQNSQQMTPSQAYLLATPRMIFTGLTYRSLR